MPQHGRPGARLGGVRVVAGPLAQRSYTVIAGVEVEVLVRYVLSGLLPTDYDKAPEPVFVNDNAPDSVDIRFRGTRRQYERTNEGVNTPAEYLFMK